MRPTIPVPCSSALHLRVAGRFYYCVGVRVEHAIDDEGIRAAGIRTSAHPPVSDTSDIGRGNPLQTSSEKCGKRIEVRIDDRPD